MCKVQRTQVSTEKRMSLFCIAIGRDKVGAKTSQVELSIWWIVNSATRPLKASTFSMVQEAKSYAEEEETQIVGEWSEV